MIVTTTPSLEGYHITKYIGTVTGAATYLIGGVIGEGMFSSRQSSQFSIAWQEAVAFMKKEAYKADAIVGVQHTLCGVANGYMVVSVTGTAVNLVEEHVYRIQIEEQIEEQRRIGQKEKQKRLEEQRRREEEQKRFEEQHRQEEAQKELELQERKVRILNGLENDQKLPFSVSIEERQRLITGIDYAMNLISPSKQRAKLKQINLESGKEVIDFLLSLSDDDLKPIANTILKKLKDEA